MNLLHISKILLLYHYFVRYKRSISILSKKTLLTSKDSKMSYQLSINDIIWHILNNPSLMKHMYFDLSINSEIKSEYQHSTL